MLSGSQLGSLVALIAAPPSGWSLARMSATDSPLQASVTWRSRDASLGKSRAWARAGSRANMSKIAVAAALSLINGILLETRARWNRAIRTTARTEPLALAQPLLRGRSAPLGP